jgi:multidrug efflux pump subunit AcrA (membrane-fusion protein)
MLIAPPVGGDSLQITHLASTGQLVKKGDVVVEFDPSEQHYKLEQSHSELMEAEQEIAKAQADAVVLAAEDKVALLKARYGVRSAELDVEKNELLSKIDAEKNNLALEQANRILTETEKDLESHKQAGQAAIYLAQEKANKARLEMNQAQQNLEKLRVTAPMDGLVSVQRNMNASGGIYFTGMSLPDFHAGDQVQPGSPIAKIVDPAGMNLTCKVSELDRGNIAAGQPVQVVFDALPGQVFRGTVKNVGGMSSREFFEANSSGSFLVTIQLAQPDARLRSGFTASVLFVGTSQNNVLYLPRLALFSKDGKRLVYVKTAGGYEQREVKIKGGNESRAEIEGLPERTIVTLIDPTAPHKASEGSHAGGSPGGAL